LRKGFNSRIPHNINKRSKNNLNFIMAKIVIKRDGTKESFSSEKIQNSIEIAAKDINLPAERLTEIVKQVSDAVSKFAADKEEIASTEIKTEILRELDQIEPMVSAAWRKYDQEKGHV
ncbi:hypothetical protein COY65_01065, partial [Candidatus Jorgensenbacteria bacterium CG_4_10_14_0_8_um_filter_39_13]